MYATDWERVIERNSFALRRILASLVAMAGGLLTSPLRGEVAPQGAGGGDCSSGDVHPTPALRADPPPQGDGCVLPRHLRNSILRLLRPAESAVRRLVVIAARDLVVTLPPIAARPKPVPVQSVVTRQAGKMVRLVWQPGARFPRVVPLPPKRPPARISLALIDPLTDPTRRLTRRKMTPPHLAPRIWSPDMPKPARLPSPPASGDMLDATRIGLRLRALADVLDDLPRQARRFARWKVRRDQAQAEVSRDKSGRPAAAVPAIVPPRFRRTSPLKPGRPPGLPGRNSRSPKHEVHEVLGDLHYFAYETWHKPDTS